MDYLRLVFGALLLLWSTHAYAQNKPNIVVIMVDDMAQHLLNHAPLTRNVLGNAGVTFNQAIDEFALCCPSRATFLLGEYAHNHGVETNRGARGGWPQFRPHENRTIAVKLQDAGYRTAMLGKYVNRYPEDAPPHHVPPGWDHWLALLEPQDASNSPINRNGVRTNLPGYQTDTLSMEAKSFMTLAARVDEPFFVWLSFSAPHQPSIPAARHANLFPGLRAPRTPAFNERDVSDKPAFLRLPRLSRSQISEADTIYRRQIQSLQAVDEAVRSIVNHLQSEGELDNTYVFFLSDNGFHNGEHRMTTRTGGGKQFAYETDLRIPFLARGPGVSAGRVDSHIVGNVDLPVTIMEIAGLQASSSAMDGRSLLPLMHGQTPSTWRESFPIVRYQDPFQPQFSTYFGVRTNRYTWVEWANGARELYDHVQDPHNLNNLASTSSLAGVRSLLSAITNRLSDCAGQECRDIEKSRRPMTTILDKLRPEPRDALAASFSEQFEKDHQAGAMTLTASRWPAVLDLPPELKDDWLAHVPAKLSLALHLLGVVPFDNAASPLFERGKDMEIVGQRRLERLGFKIKAVQPRFVHPSMSALAYPDLIAIPPDESEEVPVELKVVDAVPDFREKWAKAPPLPYTLQLMCQMACSGHQRGYIAALVLVWKGLELHLYRFERDAEIIETLERRGQEFLDLIASTPAERLAEMLVEENSPDSYRAWSRVAALSKGSTAQFLEPEAVRRVQELHQARLDKRKGETAEEAALGWLAAHLPPNAENIELLDGWSIKRSVVKTPEKKIPQHVRPARQHVTLKVVKPAGEETGDV